MKRLIIISLALAAIVYCNTAPAWAQYLGNKQTFGTSTMYLDQTDYGWKLKSDNDTVAISPGAVLNLFTKPFQAPNKQIRLEGKAILTAATDSFKAYLYGSNDKTIDTTMITLIDSTASIVAAGKYVKVFTATFAPWYVIKYVALAKAASVTGKSCKTTIGVE